MLVSIPILAGLTVVGHIPPPPIQEVAARLAETKSREAAALRNYTVLRHYVLTTAAGHSAEMMARLTYSSSGGKKFDVLWERGSSFIQRRVFRKLLEAEEDAARQDVRVTPDNYELRLEGVQTIAGRRCYVVGLEPRQHNKYLLHGKAWVDAADFAVVRVEGEPLGTGSFWIRSTHMVQDYRKLGRFWLPVVTQSDSQVRIFGSAHLTIDSFDYELNGSRPDTQAEIDSHHPPLE